MQLVHQAAQEFLGVLKFQSGLSMGTPPRKGPPDSLLLPLLLSCFSRVRLCDPIDGSPPGSSVPGILQARILE